MKNFIFAILVLGLTLVCLVKTFPEIDSNADWEVNATWNEYKLTGYGKSIMPFVYLFIYLHTWGRGGRKVIYP